MLQVFDAGLLIGKLSEMVMRGMSNGPRSIDLSHEVLPGKPQAIHSGLSLRAHAGDVRRMPGVDATPHAFRSSQGLGCRVHRRAAQRPRSGPGARQPRSRRGVCRHSEVFDRRRRLMESWASYVVAGGT